MMQEGRILIVDDEAGARHALAMVLEQEGYDVKAVPDGFSALAAFGEVAPALTISDVKMPGMHGIDLLRRIKQRDPDAAVVMMTGFGEIESAVEAMREGALDYLRKPLDVDVLLRIVESALKHFNHRRMTLPPVPTGRSCCDGIVGVSAEMQRLFKCVEQVAATRATVLLTGESGTGKEVVASAIHRGSPRAAGPFVRLSCAALSESLLESELFGHERGAFTGADKRRCGRIEQADGGTLFLDEIGEVSPAVQVKLLRVLQERAFERVGGNETLRVDVRILAATNRNLRALVAEGRFREDLFYRLDVVSLHLPPLRERRSDIPALASHFLRKHAVANGSVVSGYSDAALGLLVECDWPGNVRQLENAVEHALVFAKGSCVDLVDLPPELQDLPKAEQLPSVPGANMNDFERYAILKTMEAVGGSTRRTAELLGISVRKIQYRLREYSAAPTSKLPSVRPGCAA